MNEVYVIAGGEWLRNNLNAIAAFMNTRTWDSIEKSRSPCLLLLWLLCGYSGIT